MSSLATKIYDSELATAQYSHLEKPCPLFVAFGSRKYPQPYSILAKVERYCHAEIITPRNRPNDALGVFVDDQDPGTGAFWVLSLLLLKGPTSSIDA